MIRCCPKRPGVQPGNQSEFATQFAATRFERSLSAVKPDTVVIPGGTALLGTAKSVIHFDSEAPLRYVPVASFLMSRATITNVQFAAFVADTGYVTEAEHLGWSFVFHDQVPSYIRDTQAVPGAGWWRKVDGANWQRITGPRCSLVQELPDHPVVHVSWNDAQAYCSWIGGRLPTEAQWEHAARGALGDVRFPWGNVEPDDVHNLLCNIWQGNFPHANSVADGYRTTAPAVSFGVNGYGLYNMVGNVWEWTHETFSGAAQRIPASQPASFKVAKGGSFLCHKSYCYRYRIAARIGNTSDSSTTHMGFRVVWDIDGETCPSA